MTAPVVLVNLTPHELVIDPGDGAQPVRIPASGTVPRLVLSPGERERLLVADPDRPQDPAAAREVPLVVGARWVGVDPPLPDPRPGTLYATSRIVAEQHPDRTDLVWPDDLLRDEAGRVVAARRLARPAAPRPAQSTRRRP